MSSFSTRHPEFLESSIVGAWPGRLDARHTAIIKRNRDLFRGARVLDLASHDGRWSLAALDAGAAHVVGVEVRPELIEAAERNLAAHSGRCRFVCADAAAFLESVDQPFDLVLCLGYLYHTAEHVRLIAGMARTRAPALIIDTRVSQGGEPAVTYRAEPTRHPANGFAPGAASILIGEPTVAALRLFLSTHGYSMQLIDWRRVLRRHGPVFDTPLGPDNPVADYARGERVTLTARRVDRG